uniref:Sestrin 2 n=1 Tax=Paramormyrops kingsleyae TaxID=1676925 RepID=A0A3B3SER0_9TELE
MLDMMPATASGCVSEASRQEPGDVHREAVAVPSSGRLARLCSRDEKERAAALEALSRGVLSSASPGADGEPGLQRDTLLHLLRVSRTCPLLDIRERAAELLRMAQARGVEVPQALVTGPSAFIPAEEILQELGGLPDLVEAFLSTGRVDHVTMVMALHPSYLRCFLRTQQALLQLDGPLPCHWRHYIVVMASARHRCSYLVQLHSDAFLQAGGDERWLQGLHCVPTKLRHLNLLNKLLAHRPWLLAQEHIADLVCPTSEQRWSLAELIHAVVILVHAHSLSSFVWGCGINPELDHVGGHTFRPPSPSAHVSRSPAHEAATEHQGGTNGEHEVELLMQRMQLLQRQQEQEEFSPEEMVTRFERERSERLLGQLSDVPCALPDSVSRFVEDAEFAYQDFAPRGEQAPPTLRAQVFSWEDHGFSLMNRLYPDMGQLLDEKFQVVSSLTYRTMAMHCDVDTSMLRKAVCNYIQCVFGIRYDDYDYGDVNQLLELQLKIYIKTVACHPEETSARMYAAFWRFFQHSEKVRRLLHSGTVFALSLLLQQEQLNSPKTTQLPAAVTAGTHAALL